MTRRTASFTTPRASSYLQQLCKHFGHKVPVEITPRSGRIELPFGVCQLAARDEVLTLQVEGASPDIARLEKVISDHLARFAFRENPVLDWRAAA